MIKNGNLIASNLSALLFLHHIGGKFNPKGA
jgi:hypothetical protein